LEFFREFKLLGEDAKPFINRMIRHFILHKNITAFDLNPLKKGKASIIYDIAADYLPDTVSSFVEAQDEVSKRRTTKVDNRLAQLQTQKDALPKAKKKKSVKSLINP
jgi:hypothetical protein